MERKKIVLQEYECLQKRHQVNEKCNNFIHSEKCFKKRIGIINNNNNNNKIKAEGYNHSHSLSGHLL